ncbi:murein hydrolase activator EnvC family protein [Sulfurospirillum arcachonense]|uniref:murein hydrolase activator EnvC family protein n=1 Tax=Sulfurospirillum arcachonense TaxID=57666 RepID=UPI0004681AAB|nr:M23 family metallopeptidase [Sulfurospirillum arcachonense]
MRILFVIVALHVVLFSAISVEKKISKNQKDLKLKSKVERSIARKLNDVAQDILKEEKNLNNIKSKIEGLGKNIAKNQNVVKDKEINLKDLTKQNLTLLAKKKDLEEKIVKVIAEDFSFYLISDKGYLDSVESILVDETVDKIGIIIQKEFAKLSHDYDRINKKIDVQNSQIKDIKASIKSLKNQKVELSGLEKSKVKSIKKLDSQRASYRKRLLDITNERNEIRATLKKLKIIKAKEDAAEKRARLAALKKAQKDGNINGKMTVRQIGSSYQNSRVKKYRGSKTIAPLDSFSVKRKFGAYVDPIYKIKIFNESVILTANEKNAKVKNVLNGKVIYAKDTAVLDKVVIVENSYGIHTIYAHLSKIAPTIEVGKKIKKGYVIGRVEDDLSFEVTQKSYHINPLELIRY